MTGFPIPTAGYWPRPFQDYQDAGFLALTAKMDEIFSGIQNDLSRFRYLRRVEKMGRAFVNAMSVMLVAGVTNTDTDAQAVRKVYHAWTQKQYRSSWANDVQPKIKNITGIQPVLYTNPLDDWWAWIGSQTPGALVYWSTWGGGGVGNGLDDLDVGMIWGGTGAEAFIPGIVFIDLGSSSITSDQIAQIITSIITSIPAYFRVFLGYTSGGQFFPFSGGQIN